MTVAFYALCRWHVTKLPPLPPFPASHRERETPKLSRFRLCEVCGQTFDTEDLDQVFHHDPKPHLPMPPKPSG